VSHFPLSSYFCCLAFCAEILAVSATQALVEAAC
jgi:hypothetical protein